jgi:hypothetical protein
MYHGLLAEFFGAAGKVARGAEARIGCVGAFGHYRSYVSVYSAQLRQSRNRFIERTV